eukprot:7360982-Lingulodinium_polyedra.AAC.1
MPKARTLLSTMPPLPGLQLPVRGPPWDTDGSMPPMMRSRARWTDPNGEDMPVGPAWQHAARHLLF